MIRTKLAVILLGASVAACGPGARNGMGGDDNGDDTTGDDGGGDDGGSGSGSGSGSNGDNCSDASKLVYVVDQNNTLSTFDPPTQQFHDLGTLSCPAGGGATPFSMGIDRNAGAWVLYSNGKLFHVDTSSLACTATTWASPSGLMQFGMGFSTDTAGGTTDTLFIAGGTSPTESTSKLAKVDTGALTAAQVGTVQGWPELTGTGNAELWGFFPSVTDVFGDPISPPRMAKIDKDSGATNPSYTLSSLDGQPTAWAFAFYGGDFYIFLAKDTETFTTVYHVSGTNGSILGSTHTSRTIVGAGVSTCAPVVIQ